MIEYCPISTPRGHVIFADDVRREDSGKLIYVGVYTGGLVLHQAPPLLLPQFCVSVTYIERPGESDDPVHIVIHAPWDEEGSPAAKVEFPVDEFRNSPVTTRLEDAQRSASLQLGFSPFAINSTGDIVVTAERGGKYYRLGRLPITIAATEQSATKDMSLASPDTPNDRGPGGSVGA